MRTTVDWDEEIELGLEPLARLSRDLKLAARTLTPGEVRFFVDMYYQMQKGRIMCSNQVQSSAAEPTALLQWLRGTFNGMETRIKLTMQEYVNARRDGRWLLSICGIGPVIAAGMLAHLNVENALYPSRFWRFAGLDPTIVWKKGEKRPYNARLKVLCWKASDSFVKNSGRDDCFYGKLYIQRKQYEVEKNSRGDHASQAAAVLAKTPKHKQRAVYEAGMLPPGHVDARARRWVAKLLLSHLHHVMYEVHHSQAPPRPYTFDIMGHRDYIAPPGWPCE